ncbi:hypothetical protein EV361DRAFT_955777 [Lentinula raphanica]|nr:hypothetical protein F5880DRAFT_1619386 [Lentinula raphanica]KAJ3964618.1 hypothetical protein EV361DRAFT_955777 [Lentinula raphanica]
MLSKSAVLKNASDLVKETILTSFEVGSLTNGVRHSEPVSPSALEEFNCNPEQTLNLSRAQLDLSGETLISLKESSWNQNLIYQLARRAQAVAERSETRNLYLLPKEEISWDELVKDRIHRILREVHHQRTTDSDISKKRSRSVRLWKHNRRQSLAVLAGQACQEKGDTEGEDSWGFLLCAIGSLQVDGMSDEEDGEEDGNPVRLVLNAAFRRKEFRPLFRFIDSNPAGIEKGQGGRRFKKRVEIAKEVSPSRKLLNTIPSAFLSPAYQSQGYQGAAKDVEVNFSKMLRYFHKEGLVISD